MTAPAPASVTQNTSSPPAVPGLHLRRVLRPSIGGSTWTVHVETVDGSARYVVLVDVPKDGPPWCPAAWTVGYEHPPAPAEARGLALGSVYYRLAADAEVTRG